jgi:hypothetical protein
VSSGCESGQWPLSDIIGTHEVKQHQGCLKSNMDTLSMKEGSLSCFDLPIHGAFCCTLGTVGKLLRTRGAPNWFHDF